MLRRACLSCMGSRAAGRRLVGMFRLVLGSKSLSPMLGQKRWVKKQQGPRCSNKRTIRDPRSRASCWGGCSVSMPRQRLPPCMFVGSGHIPAPFPSASLQRRADRPGRDRTGHSNIHNKMTTINRHLGACLCLSPNRSLHNTPIKHRPATVPERTHQDIRSDNLGQVFDRPAAAFASRSEPILLLDGSENLQGPLSMTLADMGEKLRQLADGHDDRLIG